MRVFSFACLGGLLACAAMGLRAQTLSPAVSNVTSSSFTLTWTTSQKLNTQVHYAPPGQPQQSMHVWSLTQSHSVTVTGLTPGVTYTVEAESSYFSNPDLLSPPLSVTTAAGSASSSPPPPSSGSGSAPAGSSSGSTPAAAINPQVSNITSQGFTVTWTTPEPLNSQLHYGVGNTAQVLHDWTLAGSHAITVTGLTPGTAYRFQAESSYFSNPDLLGPVQSVTTLGAAPPPGSAGAPGTTSSGGVVPPPSGGSSGARLFTGAGANWLYSAPTGTGLNISSMVSGISFHVNTHDGGFDYPVQYTDGSHGCTTFTDTAYYSYKDRICVPNPANGYHPSVGGWGANDGHLVVVDTANGNYYDFWKLLVNGSGQPTGTNVGQIVQGSYATGNGTPGATAAEITGLAGDILPGELNCATCLNHALNVVVPGRMNSGQLGHQAPAVKTDGSGSGVFREGAKIRFDPSINVGSLNASTAVKAIMRALQLYGGVITDQTGGTGISFYSALPTQPDLTGINQIGQHLWLYY